MQLKHYVSDYSRHVTLAAFSGTGQKASLRSVLQTLVKHTAFDQQTGHCSRAHQNNYFEFCCCFESASIHCWIECLFINLLHQNNWLYLPPTMKWRQTTSENRLTTLGKQPGKASEVSMAFPWPQAHEHPWAWLSHETERLECSTNWQSSSAQLVEILSVACELWQDLCRSIISCWWPCLWFGGSLIDELVLSLNILCHTYWSAWWKSGCWMLL